MNRKTRTSWTNKAVCEAVESLTPDVDPWEVADVVCNSTPTELVYILLDAINESRETD